MKAGSLNLEVWIWKPGSLNLEPGGVNLEPGELTLDPRAIILSQAVGIRRRLRTGRERAPRHDNTRLERVAELIAKCTP